MTDVASQVGSEIPYTDQSRSLYVKKYKYILDIDMIYQI